MKRLFSPFGPWGRVMALALTGAPYLTPAKVLNALHCEWEILRRVVRPRSWPYIALVDVASSCNLRCPYCPTGAQRNRGRPQTRIHLKHVQRLLDELGDYLISANLFNWGEPLLHPQLAAMVEMFHHRGIFTQISTNLNTRHQDRLHDLCEAGLDYLMVSISGASQPVYEIFHQRGDMTLVWDNLRRLGEWKRRRPRRLPIIEVKYLVFQHNTHELEKARQKADELGADVFRWVRGSGTRDVMVRRKNRVQTLLSRFSLCHQLWHAVILNADGGIAPCCYLFFKEDDFGDYTTDSLKDMRQNWRFVTARKMFQPAAVGELSPEMQHPCLKCHLVHRQPHLKPYLEKNPHAVQGHRTGGP
jgi:pyruvate-formate lyase-activating enzyme